MPPYELTGGYWFIPYGAITGINSLIPFLLVAQFATQDRSKILWAVLIGFVVGLGYMFGSDHLWQRLFRYPPVPC